MSDGATNLPLVASCVEQKQAWVGALEELIDEAHYDKAAAALKSDQITQRRSEMEQRAQVGGHSSAHRPQQIDRQ